MSRGHINRRVNKNGSVTYSIMYRAGGVRIKKAIGPTRREAERALTAALGKVDRGELRGNSRETFAEAAGPWLERKRPIVEASTYQDYERNLRLRLVPEFGARKLRQITPAQIEAYVARLDREGTLSRKTINDSLIPLRQVLGRAVRDGLIARNPAISVDRDAPLELPYERPTMSYLTREQARLYLDSAPAWYRPLAEVLIGTGMRVGEAVVLEWTDIDWDASAINVSRTAKVGGVGTPKGDRARSVVIASYLREALLEHRAAEDRHTGLLFPAADGKARIRQAVRYHGHLPTLKDAGLPAAIRLHDLRHTAATLWLASGESIYFIQQQLGHKDIQTTIDQYGHPDKDAHRQAAERAAEWWRNGAPAAPTAPQPVPRGPRAIVDAAVAPETAGQ